jgi:hypothetical protein
MLFCKELLVTDWGHCANLVETREGYKTHQESIRVPFLMDIIMIMCCCICKERNGWIFNNEDSSVEHCKIRFKLEFALVIRRAKESRVPDMQSWLANIG